MKIRELKDKGQRDIIDSEIQRNLIWKDDFKIRLIESILDHNPIGVITLFQQDNQPYLEIIDGKQRIYAIESFGKGEFSYKERNFSGLTLAEKEQFGNYEIIIQEASGTFDDKVKLFDKINTCLVPLNKFELLRAQFYGNLLLDISEYVSTDKNINLCLNKTARGENETIILDIIREGQNLTDFLKANKDKYFNVFSKLPKQIFTFIVDVFKDYKNIKILIELARTYKANKGELFANRDAINNDIKTLLKTNHIEGGNKTSAYERILDRYTIEKDPKRLFSPAFKQDLWDEEFSLNQKVFCKLCLQEIDSIDKAETDHIKAGSQGGTTDYKNAQLTHKYCNIKKGKR